MRIKAHGQGRPERIGAPWVEELVGPKIPAGGGRAVCRAGRSAHSAHRPVNTDKGGLCTKGEQRRVRSGPTPGQATAHIFQCRINACMLRRGALMSHLSMAGGVSRGRLLTSILRSAERGGVMLVASSMSVYGKRATCTYQASRGVFSKSLASQPGRVQALTCLHADQDIEAGVTSWPDE